LQESLEKAEKIGFIMWFDTFGVFKSALEEIFSPSAAYVILQSLPRSADDMFTKGSQ